MGVPPKRPPKPSQPDTGAQGTASSDTASGIRAMLEAAIAAEAAEEAAEAEAANLREIGEDDDETTTMAAPGPALARALRAIAPSMPRPLPAEEEATTPGLPPAPPPLARFGRYEVVSRIAYGGMAEVFLAREQTIVGATRLVAIKRMLPHVSDDGQFVSMFLDESRVALQLQHPNVCTCYEVGSEAGSPFLVMEYIDGRSLAQLIDIARGSGGLAPEIAVRIIAQVAEGLHYAHRVRDVSGVPLNIIHRDVSPSNIMIARDGQVKLLDFGVAKARSHATKTRSGIVKGKFAYMAPEQCRGAVVDARADVFALGICLFEALTRKPLYQRESEYATMTAVLTDPPPSPHAVDARNPVELDAIVQCALAKLPAERFATALDFQTALESWLATTGTFVNAARIAASIERLAERGQDPVSALLDELAEEGKPASEHNRPAARAEPPDDDGPTLRGRAPPRSAEAFSSGAGQFIPPTRPGDRAQPAAPAAPRERQSAVATQKLAPMRSSPMLPLWVPVVVVGGVALLGIALGLLWLLLH